MDREKLYEEQAKANPKPSQVRITPKTRTQLYEGHIKLDKKPPRK